MNFKKILIGGAAGALMLGAVAVSAFAAGTDWMGQSWTNAGYGSIAVNSSGNLEVTASTCSDSNCWGTAHYNTPAGFRASSNQVVEWTFIDEGPNTAGAQLWMEQESGNNPSWTQFGAWQREGFDTYRIYWWNERTNTDGWVNTNVKRTAGEHTFALDRESNGDLQYWLDGKIVFTSNSSSITPDYLGDIYLAAHSSTTGGVVTYTNYQTSTALPASKEDCMKNGWSNFILFKNQGECVSYLQANPNSPR